MKLYELMPVISAMSNHFGRQIDTAVITPDNKIAFDCIIERKDFLREYANMEVIEMEMEFKYNICVIYLK